MPENTQGRKTFLNSELYAILHFFARSLVPGLYDRQFLGYRLLSDGRLVISDQSVKRIQDKVRNLTWRNRGVSLAKVIFELNEALRG